MPVATWICIIGDGQKGKRRTAYTGGINCTDKAHSANLVIDGAWVKDFRAGPDDSPEAVFAADVLLKQKMPVLLEERNGAVAHDHQMLRARGQMRIRHARSRVTDADKPDADGGLKDHLV